MPPRAAPEPVLEPVPVSAPVLVLVWLSEVVCAVEVAVPCLSSSFCVEVEVELPLPPKTLLQRLQS